VVVVEVGQQLSVEGAVKRAGVAAIVEVEVAQARLQEVVEVTVVAVAGEVVQEAVEVVTMEASLQLLGRCQQHGSFYREAGNKCPQRVQKFFCVVCSAFLPKHFFCFLCFLLCTNVSCYSH
jgi:hypothetical protein